MTQNRRRLKHVVPNYAVYMGLFIGTGFLSGSIVHFPMDPLRYFIIGLIGATVFVASSTINEIIMQGRQATAKEFVKLIAFSILLALGVGMISGGVQHFDEVPVYASQLIPLGIILSLAGYILKNGIDLHKHQTLKLGAATIVFVALLGTGLSSYANSITTEGHGHGEEKSQTVDSSPSENTPSVQTPNTSAEPEPTESEDGHGH